MPRCLRPCLIALAAVLLVVVAAVVAFNLHLQSATMQEELRRAAMNSVGLPLTVRSAIYTPWDGIRLRGLVMPDMENAGIDYTTALQKKGAERIAMLVDGPAGAVREKLSSVDGVLGVNTEGGDGSPSRLTVECKLNTDLRRTLAAVVVNEGWGLLELRGVSVSLEDVFINLITNE